MNDLADVSPEAAASGETIDIDGVPCDVEKVKESVRRCVNAVIVLRRWERRYSLFPDGSAPLPPRELRKFTRELDEALVGEL